MEKENMSRVRVLRFDPDKNPSAFFQEYLIPFDPESTIMDALYYIYTHLDGSLAFRGSCTHGWCNVCMLKTNGKVFLPCKKFMLKEMTIEPLPRFPVIRDLIVDRSVKRGTCEEKVE
jgi:succinate dehydrogenase/fumarate reductase iron-sulfur protein